MPIRTLDCHPITQSISDLKDTVIGIDVLHYINSILSNEQNYQNWLITFGDELPIFIKNRIINDSNEFIKNGIKPIFVFPGLKSVSQFIYSEQPEFTPYEKYLQSIWGNNNNNNNNNNTFTNITSFNDLSLIRSLTDDLTILFRDNNLDFIISPFLQYNQLYYMLKSNIINCIYSSNEMLLFEDLDNFIIDLDFTTKSFRYLSINQILNDFQISFNQFKNISMSIGNIIQPLMLVENNYNFRNLIKSDIYSMLSNQSNKIDLLINGIATLNYCPVLKIDGRVELINVKNSTTLLFDKKDDNKFDITKGDVKSIYETLNNDQIPENLNNLFCSRLPEEIYFYQSIGLNIFKIFESILHKNYIERLPLDMLYDSIYGKIVTGHQSMKIKELSLYLISLKLNRFYQNQKISLKSYYQNKSLPTTKSLDFKLSLPKDLTTLFVRHSTAKSFDLTTIIKNLNNSFLNECSYPSKEVFNLKIYSNHEILSTSLLRTLYDYKFIELNNSDNNSFILSKWGQSLLNFSIKNNLDIEITLLISIFLQRFNDIKIDELFKSSFDKQFDKKELSLIIKFTTFFKPLINPIKNDFKFNQSSILSPSQDLLHFRSIVEVMKHEIKDLITIHLINILLENRSDLDKFSRTNKDWTILSSELPFKSSISSTIYSSFIRDVLSSENKEAIFEKYNNEVFKNSKKVYNEIIKFLKTVCLLAESFDELLKPELINSFKSMNVLLNSL